MMTHQDRRIEGIKRVPVEALVEVCGLGQEVQAFEAESRNVSDRGIRLRTAYLPDLGAPVVCRFDTGGQEVLAEGVIAWRKQQARGGEFGVRFTALNAQSAQILGQMCRPDEPAPSADGGKPLGESAATYALPAGTRVKLHIDGLSSPMRARVQQGDANQICVNSSLEFLKLGKRLQLENVEAGAQSEAYIDGIDVVIDPDSGVPNLVVVLRSQDVENTPEPSIIDTQSDSMLGHANSAQRETVHHANTQAPDADAYATVTSDVTAMRGKLEESVSRVGLIVKITGAKAADLGKSLCDRGGPLVQRMVRSWSGGRRNRAQATAPRRRTAPPPVAVAGAAARNLRPQAPSCARLEQEVRPTTKSRKRAIIAAAGAGVLLVTVTTLASRGAPPSPASNSSNPQARAVASAPLMPLASVTPSTPAASAAPVARRWSRRCPYLDQRRWLRWSPRRCCRHLAARRPMPRRNAKWRPPKRPPQQTWHPVLKPAARSQPTLRTRVTTKRPSPRTWLPGAKARCATLSSIASSWMNPVLPSKGVRSVRALA